MELKKEKCSRCGYDKHKGSLYIHHIDGNHKNNTPDNLVVLCANCHFEVHHTTKLPKFKKSNAAEIERQAGLKNLFEGLNELRAENESLKNELVNLKQYYELKNTAVLKFIELLPYEIDGFYYHNRRIINELYEKTCNGIQQQTGAGYWDAEKRCVK